MEKELKFKQKRVFTSIEVCKLLARECGVKDDDGRTVDVNWQFREKAEDNTIEVVY